MADDLTIDRVHEIAKATLDAAWWLRITLGIEANRQADLSELAGRLIRVSKKRCEFWGDAMFPKSLSEAFMAPSDFKLCESIEETSAHKAAFKLAQRLSDFSTLEPDYLRGCLESYCDGNTGFLNGLLPDFNPRKVENALEREIANARSRSPAIQRVRKRSQNADRDDWIKSQAEAGKTHKEIRNGIPQENADWNTLATDQAVSAVLKRLNKPSVDLR